LDCVLTLDVGSSSARTLLYGFDGREIPGFGSQVKYQAHTSEDGAWEIDPAALTGFVAQAFTEICQQLRAKAVRPAAVAVDTFWHSLVGVAQDGTPTTAILHPFDSRCADAASRLTRRLDNLAQHARTGCMLHSSYPPAKLLWLSETQPKAFRAAARWMSVGEFLFLEFFGQPAASTSMISASGLWDQNRADYDDELLAALPVERPQFADPATLDAPVQSLRAHWSAQWPELDGIPWFPALGDGACDNIGSGCVSKDRWALMVGTSGALRATIEADRIDIPHGLFCYRIDPQRFVVGGALSNGGAVYAWMKRTLQLPDEATLEAQLAAMKPGMHGLTILPLFAGERSTEWRSDTTAAIAGLRSSTTPAEILHAAMESVALRFRNVYDVMVKAFGAPRELVGSGAALLHSAVWTQMMTDTLCHPLFLCLEPEATARGAALLALERLGVLKMEALKSLAVAQPAFGPTLDPDPVKMQLYVAALAVQRRLYSKLFEEK
jgi:gluconokinase